MRLRYLISVLLCVAYFFFPKVGYTFSSQWDTHFLYPLCHANIFHLAANIFCLLMFKSKLRLYYAIPIAIICSFLPPYLTEETMGFSGVLFAVLGLAWGSVGRLSEMCRKVLPFVLLTLFLPHVNGFIHLYCLFMGYIVMQCDKRLRTL